MGWQPQFLTIAVLSLAALSLSLSLSPSTSFSPSLYLSLSLPPFVLLSGCFCGHILSSAPICFHTCLPCSLQVVSLTPSPLLFFSQAALGRMNFLASYVSPTFLPLFRSPCSSLTCCACLCSVCFGTKPIVRYIPLASVSARFYPAYLPALPNLSPFPLSTIMLLSGSPAFGMERKACLLFPFFPYLFLSSFPVFLYFPPYFCYSRWVLLGPSVSMCSLCVLSEPIFPTCCYLLFLSRIWDLWALLPGSCVPSFPALWHSCSLHSFLSLLVTVPLSGCFWAQDPLCLPFVSVFVPLVVPNLFPLYLLLFYAVLLSGHFWDAKFSLFSICFRASPLVTSYYLL